MACTPLAVPARRDEAIAASCTAETCAREPSARTTRAAVETAAPRVSVATAAHLPSSLVSVAWLSRFRTSAPDLGAVPSHLTTPVTTPSAPCEIRSRGGTNSRVGRRQHNDIKFQRRSVAGWKPGGGQSRQPVSRRRARTQRRSHRRLARGDRAAKSHCFRRRGSPGGEGRCPESAGGRGPMSRCREAPKSRAQTLRPAPCRKAQLGNPTARGFRSSRPWVWARRTPTR